ncbi:MAG: hypothetical protein B7X11_03040, partial [Acidobacteria bacterium 37-65-4]
MKKERRRPIQSGLALAARLHRDLATRVRLLVLRMASSSSIARNHDLIPSASSSQHQQLAAVGLLGRGKDGTLVYPATQIPSRFAPDACVVVERVSAASSSNACIDASDVAALVRAGLDDEVAIKDVRDEVSAQEEAAIHAHLRSCFRGAHRMTLCCLHPKIASVYVDGHVLLPMRVGASIDRDGHFKDAASSLLDLSRCVLGA